MMPKIPQVIFSPKIPTSKTPCAPVGCTSCSNRGGGDALVFPSDAPTCTHTQLPRTPGLRARISGVQHGSKYALFGPD